MPMASAAHYALTCQPLTGHNLTYPYGDLQPCSLSTSGSRIKNGFTRRIKPLSCIQAKLLCLVCVFGSNFLELLNRYFLLFDGDI